MVNIDIPWDFEVDNIPVQLQHNVHISWGVIAFTLQLGHELVWKFKEVTQRLISKSSQKIGVENILLKLKHSAFNAEELVFTWLIHLLLDWKFRQQ